MTAADDDEGLSALSAELTRPFGGGAPSAADAAFLVHIAGYFASTDLLPELRLVRTHIAALPEECVRARAPRRGGIFFVFPQKL